MSETIEILFEERGSLGIVTLNRPHVLNALNNSMCVALSLKLAEWEKNSQISAVAICGTGRAFCAGGDLRFLYENRKALASSPPKLFGNEYQLNQCIFNYPKPYIALLNGITMGGGAGISIHGSHRVATEHLVFAMPETAIGFFPDVGASYFLSRLPYKFGFYLGLTAEHIAYNDCYALGLIDYVVRSEDCGILLERLSQTNSLQEIDDIIKSFAKTVPPSALFEQAEEVEYCFAKTSVEGILQALETVGSDWGKKTAATLLKRSPTSLKITLRELLTAETQDFKTCMQMEARLARRFLPHHDLIEGIRAAVIDKDQMPHWQPNTLPGVTEEIVNSFFK